MRKKQAESGLKRTVREFLEWHHFYVVTVQGGPFGTPGISDLIAIRDKRILFLEIKTPDGKVSADQKEFGRNVHEKGGEYFVIRDVDDLKDLGCLQKEMDKRRACDSCERRLYKAGGLLRCIEGRNVTRCSRYVGPFKEFHVSLPYEAEYAESLTREKGVTKLKIRKGK